MAKDKNSNKGYRDSGDADIHDADRVDGSEDDERLADGIIDMRASREEDSHEAVSREADDAELLDSFNRSLFQTALPELPEDDANWHYCWLTVDNKRDPIAGRMRLGYQLLKATDIPGFEHTAISQGDYAGYVGVNEMIAARIKTSLYYMFMNEAHHKAPGREEEKLRAMNEVIAEQARQQSGKAPEIGDGTAALGKGPKRGIFGNLR